MIASSLRNTHGLIDCGRSKIQMPKAEMEARSMLIVIMQEIIFIFIGFVKLR